MARRKIIPDKSEVNKLAISKEQLSLKELHDRVIKETNNKKGRTLEQKIIALKILKLNNMKYTLTSGQVGVTKKTLWLWWQQYGETITISEPEYYIAETVENDLALLMKDAYNSVRKSIKKLDQLVDQATSVRHIYPVVEALRACIEVIKLDKQNNGDGDKEDDFFGNVYKMMTGDGNKG